MLGVRAGGGFHCCQRWSRWSRTPVELVLGPAAGHDAQRRAEPAVAAGPPRRQRSAAATTSTAWFPARMEQGDRGLPRRYRPGHRGHRRASMSPRRLGCGPAAFGRRGTGVSPTGHAPPALGRARPCRSTQSCSPEPGTGKQWPSPPPGRPSQSGLATAPKSAPATRTAPFHTGLTRPLRAFWPGDRKGWLEPVTQVVSHQPADRSWPGTPSRTTSPSTIHMAR